MVPGLSWNLKDSLHLLGLHYCQVFFRMFVAFSDFCIVQRLAPTSARCARYQLDMIPRGQIIVLCKLCIVIPQSTNFKYSAVLLIQALLIQTGGPCWAYCIYTSYLKRINN